MSHRSTYYAHGKLLLTAEYAVLDGATALAIPTQLGQHLSVYYEDTNQHSFSWLAYDHTGAIWIQREFSIQDLKSSKAAKSDHLFTLLQLIFNNNPSIFDRLNKIETRLEFPQIWGLGSSSTLIHNLASWSGMDPFFLSFHSFGGSGYDVACAGASGPILYQLENGSPKIYSTEYAPSFSSSLYFVALDAKKNSRQAISAYKKNPFTQSQIEKMSQLTTQFIQATSLSTLNDMIRIHENIVSKQLQMPTIQQQYFSDYWGEMKSLGAWGGDFILVTNERSREELSIYLKKKGLNTLLSFEEMKLAKCKEK